MRKLFLLAALLMGIAACGPEQPSRFNMCEATCNYPNGSCAIVDRAGHAICQDGKWQMVLDGQTCINPVCSSSWPDTHKGEQAWCWYRYSDC